MTYFVFHFGIWFALAFVVGLLTALLSLQKDCETGLLRRTDFLPTLCVLLFIAFAQVTYGRIALFAESAMFVILAFLAGAGLVIAFVGQASRDHAAWTFGISSLALIWLAANVTATRGLETDLKASLDSLAERAGGDSFDFEVSGRDVLLTAGASNRAVVAEEIRKAAGVRIVWGVDALSLAAVSRRAAEIASAHERPTDKPWPARPGGGAREAQASAQPGRVSDPLAEGRSVIRPPAAPSDTPAPLVWKTPADPTLPQNAEPGAGASAAPAAFDSGPCRRALATAVASEKIHFAVASASVRDESERALARLAELLKQCPGATLEIAGHADSQGKDDENRSLSLRRAQSVADYLGRIGVERSRLSSVGHGAERPLVGGDTLTSRAENRRVEFAVR